VFYYLSQHPEQRERLQREVDAALPDGRAPALADLPHLPYTLMVIKETMRIQPTVATLPRAIGAETTLGGYRLEAGSFLLISPYVLHHDARHWTEPAVFDPTRFSEANEPRIPKYVYLPFGGGPRTCIGNHFSLMEAQILLGLIARRYDLRLTPDANIVPLYQVTSYPKHGMPMALERRA
jgi:cytochrome P450